jgi:iron(III) transport system substrate-binding protein
MLYMWKLSASWVRAYIGAFALLALAALVSCAKETPQGAGDETQPAGALVVYSGRSESLVGPIIEQFSQATGVNVSVKYGGTPQIAATLLEEGVNTPADVFFAQDPGGLGAVEDMLAPLPDDLVTLVPEWARSPEKAWVGISGRARVVVYNTDRLTQGDLPTSIWDFTDPRWKGKLGWAPTNASFQTMVTAMRVMWGEERAREWLKGIQANQPKAFPNNTSIVAAVESGEIEVGFVNHYYLYRFIQEHGESFAARNYYLPDGGPGGLIMVAGAGVLKTAKNRENAEKFVRFMLSKVAQQYFAGQTYEYPLVDGVTTHHLLTPLSELNHPNVDIAALKDLQGSQAMMRDLGILP